MEELDGAKYTAEEDNADDDIEDTAEAIVEHGPAKGTKKQILYNPSWIKCHLKKAVRKEKFP